MSSRDDILSARRALDESVAKIHEIALALLVENAELRKQLGLTEQARDAFQDQCKQQSEELQELRYSSLAKSGTR